MLVRRRLGADQERHAPATPLQIHVAGEIPSALKGILWQLSGSHRFCRGRVSQELEHSLRHDEPFVVVSREYDYRVVSTSSHELRLMGQCSTDYLG